MIWAGKIHMFWWASISRSTDTTFLLFSFWTLISSRSLHVKKPFKTILHVLRLSTVGCVQSIVQTCALISPLFYLCSPILSITQKKGSRLPAQVLVTRGYKSGAKLGSVWFPFLKLVFFMYARPMDMWVDS